MSNEYYQEHAEEYVTNTVDLDMGIHYEHVLPLLEKGASILDAGCGSGRDALVFKQRGYVVEGFDASPEMVKVARSYAKVPVIVQRFETLTYENRFDLIWASATLLHVSREDHKLAYANLYRALRSKGILYCSYKDRTCDFKKDGRSFTCFTKEFFSRFVQEQTQFSLVELYSSHDLRPGREGEPWLNAVLRKE